MTKIKTEEYLDNSDMRVMEYEELDMSYSHWLTNPNDCWVSRTHEYTIEYYRDYSLVEANWARAYDYGYQYVPVQIRRLPNDAWKTYRMQLSVVHRIQILTCIHDG